MVRWKLMYKIYSENTEVVNIIVIVYLFITLVM